MCGIAGIVDARVPVEELPALVDRMRESMVHRGPDEGRSLVFAAQRAGLASRRLSIVDLEHGSQPFPNEDDTVFVSFNGEIYNHAALREELIASGHRFRSRCDTEAIVHLYEELGVECLQRLHGMFAVAIWDNSRRRLLLARDQAGMKPLYFTQTGSGFIFASEVKALLASGLVSARPDPAAIDTYLATGYCPAPMTGFLGIEKLRAGTFLVVETGEMRRGRFWSLKFENQHPPKCDEEYAEELDAVLEAAVRSHLAADVPVGAYISGGWDSSLVTELAARHADYRLKTFSLVFPDDPAIDESRYSRALAKHLGTDHHEIEFRSADLVRLLPAAARHMDEPCSAAPTILAWQLSAIASREVKTVLSGEGSDELFGGYPWNLWNLPYWLRRIVPRPPCRLLAPRIEHPRWRRAMNLLGAPDDVAADAEWSRGFSPWEKARLLREEYRNDGPDVLPIRPEAETLASCADRVQRRLSLDFTGRLPDAILMAGDKMGMAHSVEVRMPFLDHDVVRFALRLPSRMKVRRNKAKYVLSFAARRLPEELSRRKKFGLRYPAQSVMCGSTTGFVREFLLDNSREGPFDRRYLESKLSVWMSPRFREYRRPMKLLFMQSWWSEFF